jgi:hypothetical protein
MDDEASCSCFQLKDSFPFFSRNRTVWLQEIAYDCTTFPWHDASITSVLVDHELNVKCSKRSKSYRGIFRTIMQSVGPGGLARPGQEKTPSKAEVAAKIYGWDGRNFTVCMNPKDEDGTLNGSNIDSIGPRGNLLDSISAKDGNNPSACACACQKDFKHSAKAKKAKFALIFQDPPKDIDVVKQALHAGVRKEDRLKLVVSAQYTEKDGSNKDLFCICECLEVVEEKNGAVNSVHVNCSMLTRQDIRWQLRRPVYADYAPDEAQSQTLRLVENPCIEKRVKVSDVNDNFCWVLPPLIVHATMNIFSIDSVDTVNQSFKADFYCEFRLRGISEVRNSSTQERLSAFSQDLSVCVCARACARHVRMTVTLRHSESRPQSNAFTCYIVSAFAPD